jgi:hypothetical protein
VKNILFVLLIFTISACTQQTDKNAKVTKSEGTVKMTETTNVCSNRCSTVDQTICTSLFESYDLCNNKKTKTACKSFISIFSKSLQKTVDCINTCSPEPFKMSITQNCDTLDTSDYPKITERSSHLLSKLKFKSAVDLFLSTDFYEILDGALAEDLKPEIEKLKKN